MYKIFDIGHCKAEQTSCQRCLTCRAGTVAADAIPLATFDTEQRRYGIATSEP
jgi:hypothetical protein